MTDPKRPKGPAGPAPKGPADTGPKPVTPPKRPRPKYTPEEQRRVDEYVAECVAAAPPVTPELGAKLRRIFAIEPEPTVYPRRRGEPAA
jgi:hypothetical protein